MSKILKIVSRIVIAITLFLFGGEVYVAMEMICRGYSHYSMFIVGGLCFLIIGSLNEWNKKDMSLVKQGIIGAIIITTIEFITGCIVNLWLGLDVWDYSDMPFNVLGQICLPFTVLWFFASLICVFVNDFLLVMWGVKKEIPKYHIL